MSTTVITPADVEYVEGYRPGVIGRVAELHGVYYAAAWGSGFEFEGMMAQELREYFAHYQAGRDLFLTAWVGGKIVGSIAVEGSQAERPGARLRWVIVDESYHRRGIGKELLRRALEFCREAGFAQVYLWTVEGLPQSLGLYKKTGFHIVERFEDDRWSVPRVNLLLEMPLA